MTATGAAVIVFAAGAAGATCGRHPLTGHRARTRLARSAEAGPVRDQVTPGWRRLGRPDHVVPPGAAVAVAVLVATIAGVTALVVCLALAGTAALAVRSRRRTEQRRARRAQLPAALERLATALRAGASVPTALVETGSAVPPPVGPELASLGHQAQAGRALVDVLDAWRHDRDDAGTGLAATALALATVVGTAPGHAVDGVAATLRERADLADERRALASQARLSALVLAVAPVGFALLLGFADGAASSFLFRTPAGLACLTIGLALDATGVWWMARLTKGPES